MKPEEARQRIEAAIEQYGQNAGNAIELVINDVRSDHGAAAVNDLIDEFDLELFYNIPPMESNYSTS
jgi:predicted RNase H-like HicB family nuclease